LDANLVEAQGFTFSIHKGQLAGLFPAEDASTTPNDRSSLDVTATFLVRDIS
jgi:hypothetical protein